MKQTLIILFSVLGSWLCAQNVSSWIAPDTLLDDSGRILHIEERGGENRSLYYEYSDSGILQEEIFLIWKNNTQYERVTEYYDNGKIKTQFFWYILDRIFFGKSSLDSTYSEFDEQENLIKSIEFKNNKINGNYIVYYPNGQIERSTEYVNDMKNGEEITYFKNGQTASQLIYEQDRISSAKYFNSEGVEFENKEFISGEGKLFLYEFGEYIGYCIFKKGKSKKCNCN